MFDECSLVLIFWFLCAVCKFPYYLASYAYKEPRRPHVREIRYAASYLQV